MEVDVLQPLGALPIFRSDLEDDVILIELGVDDGDFGLAEGGIEAGVERRGGLAELGGGDAVEFDVLVEAAILLVGVDVLQSRELLHPGEQPRSPGLQEGGAVGLDGVLIERIAAAAADAEVLCGLEEDRGDGQTIELWAQAIDDLRRADLAHIEWFQCGVDEAGVGGAAAAGEGDDVLHGGVRLNYGLKLVDGVVHRGKGGILRSLHASDQRPGVLLGEESLGDFDDDDDVESDGEQ